MRGGLLTIDAPDGGSGKPLTFEHLDAAEARFLYEEIFVARSYAQRFAKPLKSNATIVDIGANIGVFALWALRGGLSDEASERSVGALLAIEPIARTHAVLRRNLAPWPCADALRVAVGQRNEIEPCLFEFYPDQPGESTRNAAERAAQRRRLKNSALARRARAAELASAGAAAHAEPGAESPEEPAAERERCTVRSLHWILSRWEPLHGGSLPSSLPSTAAPPTRRALKRQRRDRSDVAALPRIDLLKIDVEGDELACLLGLDRVDDSSDGDGESESASASESASESASSGGNGGSGGVPRRRAVEWTWWQRIERIVVEVRASRLPLHPFHANSSLTFTRSATIFGPIRSHKVHDVDGRLAAVVALLRARGFRHVRADQAASGASSSGATAARATVPPSRVRNGCAAVEEERGFAYVLVVPTELALYTISAWR